MTDGSTTTEPESVSPEMGVTVNVVKGFDTSQAIVQGEYVPSAGAYFDLYLRNAKSIPITDVKFVSKSDNQEEVNVFEAAGWSTPLSSQTIQPDGYSTTGSTQSFSLENYANVAPGVTDFAFTFSYDYTKGDGTIINDQPITGTVQMEIWPDQCSGGVNFNSCTNDGRVCTYLGNGQPPQLIPDAECCANIGWQWRSGNRCVPPGTCISGECKYTDESQCTGGLDANTYCGADESWVEDCLCPACDAQGHFSVGCSNNIHQYNDYSQGGVIVNVSTVTLGACISCTQWSPIQDNACMQEGCFGGLTEFRTCTPDICTPADGLPLDRCTMGVSSCCGQTGWEYAGDCGEQCTTTCGQNGCSANQKLQYGVYNVTGCNITTTTRCVDTPECNPQPTAFISQNQANNFFSIYGSSSNIARGQTFQLSSAKTITAIELYLSRGSSVSYSTTVNVEVRNTASNLPTSTTIPGTPTTKTQGTLGTSPAWYTFTLPSPVSLPAGTYALVVSHTGATSTTNAIRISYQNSDVYSSGQSCSVVNSFGGISWSGQTSSDLAFRIIGF